MTIAKGLVDAFKSKKDCDTDETRLLQHHYFALVALTYATQDDTVEREVDPSERTKTIYPQCQYLRFADDSWLRLEFSPEGFIKNLRVLQGAD